ncbi:MAG: lysostaphin resistance A-like protein [Lachnospiraceae bacterium]
MTTKTRFSQIGMGYVLFTAASVAGQLLVGSLISLLGLWQMPAWDFLYLPVSMASMYCFGLPVFFLYMRLIPVCEEPGDAGHFSEKNLLSLALIALAFMSAGNIVGNLVSSLFNLFRSEPLVNEIEEAVTSGNRLVNYVTVILVAPIVEEWMFRKTLLDRIRGYGDKIAILMSGLMFGVFHGNFFQFFYAFLLGCLLAYVYLRSGRLAYSIGLHMFVNLMGSAVPLTVIAISELLPGYFQTILLFVYNRAYMLLVVCGLVLFFINVRKITLRPAVNEEFLDVPWKDFLINPGMLLFLVISLLQFVF